GCRFAADGSLRHTRSQPRSKRRPLDHDGESTQVGTRRFYWIVAAGLAAVAALLTIVVARRDISLGSVEESAAMTAEPTRPKPETTPPRQQPSTSANPSVFHSLVSTASPTAHSIPTPSSESAELFGAHEASMARGTSQDDFRTGSASYARTFEP